MTLERATRHSHYNLNYHLVFVPKYRRKVLGGKVGERLKELFEQICGEREWKIHGLEIMPDHAHIFISAPPKWAPSDIAKVLKGVSARWLMMEYPHLKANGHLWTSAYYVGSAGSVSADIIGRYIAAQQSKQVD
jgi:putative transposase